MRLPHSSAQCKLYLQAWSGPAASFIWTTYSLLSILLKSTSGTLGKCLVDYMMLACILSLKKCLLLCNEVPYLGHVISTEGIRPDPAKTDKVKSFPVLCDVTTLCQFLGLASDYCRFVPGFAKIAAPLHVPTKKDAPFNWIPV